MNISAFKIFSGGNTSFNFNSGSNALGGGTGGFGTSNFGGSLFNPQPASGTGGAVTLPSASNPQSQEMLQVCCCFFEVSFIAMCFLQIQVQGQAAFEFEVNLR